MTIASGARAAIICALVATVLAGPVSGQSRVPGDPRYADPGPAEAAPGSSWPAEKCERYRKAYAEATARFSTRGLGQTFLAGHDMFLSSNCTVRGEICPRSTEELALANVLTILAMNQGMASTFLPFGCRR